MLLTTNRGTDFPWRDGNRYRLLVDGEQFFPAMLEAIAQARHTILLDMYLFESGHIATRFINAFTEAAKRGVSVYLLLDDFGARGLGAEDRRRLHGCKGIYLAFYNPLRYGLLRRNLFRDHRKLLLIDNLTAYTGGAGITDEFDTEARPEKGWHDVMLEIRGPVIADWHRLFNRSWNLLDTPSPDEPVVIPAMDDGYPGRVSSNSPSRMDIKRSFINHVRAANQRVWIATAYFLPSRKIRRQLIQAARRGVDVRLLLPGHHTDHPAVRHAGRQYYARLLQNGVRLFEYQPRFYHAKLLLCDNWLSLGSSNIDRWNLRWNMEANQELLGGDIIETTEQLFLHDLSQCHEIKLEHWRHRPWTMRLLEWFWGKVDKWLERYARRSRKENEKD